MDWEKKFQSIVEETEANLAKVKMTLGTGGTFVDSSNIPTGDYNCWSAKYSPHVSEPLFTSTTSPKRSVADYNSLMPTRSLVSHPVSVAVSDIQGTSLIGKELEKKLEQQNTAIERLNRLVERLEHERDEYREHIKDLQHQIHNVNSRLSDSSLESANDRRVDQWRREMMTELDLIRSQLRNHVKTGSSSEFTESQMLQHSRELLELRRSLREDTDSLRRDIDGLKSRIARLEQRETDIHRGFIQNKSARSHDVSCSRGDRSMGKMEITELRANVSCLRHKVDAMEMLMLSSGSDAGRKENKFVGSRKRHQARVALTELLSDDDSLDLAGYDSSDLSLAPKSKPRQDALVYDSDEELDLNDLDLSDDKDVLSDDDVLTVDDI